MTKVLLVEDTVALAENIADILRMEGFSVLMAYNGAEGYALLEEKQPQIVITDVVMPEMDGLELTRKIRGNPAFKHIPVIILSAKTAEEDMQATRDAGANLHLKKPCDSNLLVDSIKKFIVNE